MLKPTWTYGVQLCVTANNYNIEILQQFTSNIRFNEDITEIARCIQNI